MNKNIVSLWVLLFLTAGYWLLVTCMAGLLPEHVAMHFGASGMADGWTTRAASVTFFQTLTVVPLIFVFFALILRWMPAWTFNLPHRDYWLASERRAQTVAVIAGQLLWMGCLMMVFLTGIFYLTILANRQSPPRLPMNLFVVLVGGFLAGTIIWTILLLRRFRKPPA